MKYDFDEGKGDSFDCPKVFLIQLFKYIYIHAKFICIHSVRSYR